MCNYTFGTLLSIVFESEYIPRTNDTTCNDIDLGILKDFSTTVDRVYNDSSSKKACEKYCSLNDTCWGCFTNSSTNRWKAIAKCKARELVPGEGKKELVQKPSN